MSRRRARAGRRGGGRDLATPARPQRGHERAADVPEARVRGDRVQDPRRPAPRHAVEEDVGRVIEKIKNGFEQAFSLNSHSVRVGVSVGMAIYPRDGNNLETLLSHADLSMYEDKRSRERANVRADGKKEKSLYSSAGI